MAQVMEHSEELESSRSASLLTAVQELNESQESKSRQVSNLEVELFEKITDSADGNQRVLYDRGTRQAYV